MLRRAGAIADRVFRFILLFAVVRIIVGVAAIAFFDRGAFAWGPELTIIVAVAAVVYLAVALCVRRWSSPRPS